jgi:glutamine amidotransferase
MDHLEQCVINNPDGAGYAIATIDGKLITNKGVLSWDILDEYVATVKNLGEKVTASAFHARIATHGSVCDGNCHPFKIGNGAMMHNGIISIKTDGIRTDSETFATEYLVPMGGIPHNPNVKEVIEDFIGRGSKLVFIDPSHESPLLILNEDQGWWVQWTWFSNTGYLPYTYSTSYRKSDDEKDLNLRDIIVQCSICYAENEYDDDECYLCSACLWCESAPEQCICYRPEKQKRTSGRIHDAVELFSKANCDPENRLEEGLPNRFGW